MGLFSFLRRDRSSTSDMAPRGRRAGDLPSADVVRTQARRRLIGAAVLVMVAVLVLPWVFDSKPRPLPVNIPIEVPRRDLTVALPEPPPARRDDPAAAPPVQAVEAAPAASAAPLPPAAPVAPVAPTPPPADTPPAPKADTARPPDVSKKVEDHKSKVPPVEVPVKVPPKPEPKPAKASAPDVPTKPAAEAERARAALEGRAPAPAPAPTATRFIVQVGAFEQADGAKEARQRVAKAGLQAHETTVQTAEGKRIRVRVGPFPSREAADAAAAKLRAAGIAGAVMPQ